MDAEALLRVSPEELAQALLDRRRLLKDQLPTVIRTLEAEEQNLSPKVDRVVKNHKRANDAVAKLKSTRDSSQKIAHGLLPKVRGHRDSLVESGGMVSLDPDWKKEKLFEELDEIEDSIQTSALDHKAEKKMIDRRKKLIGQNEKWLKERRQMNPEMVDYVDSRREMSHLFKTADKSHRDMIKAVEKAQPLHEKKVAMQAEIRDIRRVLDRAKELLSQSDDAIGHWERRLKDGFGELGLGFTDLLAAKRRVAEGGDSTFARKTKANNQKGGKNNPRKGKSNKSKHSAKANSDKNTVESAPKSPATAVETADAPSRRGEEE
ncbi:TPA: hypothetical protein HA325_02390 [Candidatus Thalassarchaeaceae archaeon]|mgnify:FL=1|jgi:uncharacterized coiled-coil DUF342 family protein|nr:hypothetical protein [Candidatus Thalassarchaeaceae archaeon]